MSNETWWWGAFLAFVMTGVVLWLGWELIEGGHSRVDRAAALIGLLFALPFGLLFWVGTFANAQLVIR